MSATETPVSTSVAVAYPLGTSISCSANTIMPLSSQKSEDGLDSMDSNESSSEFGINLKETLQGLQSLNGETTFKDDRVIGLKKLPGISVTEDGLNNKHPNSGKDKDVVILDDSDEMATDNAPKQTDGSLNTSSNTNSNVINLLDTKQSPFAINDKVRSSFRDIMTKIQVNTPSLGKLLSKTKYIDCKDPNCKNLAEKNRIEAEQVQQNGMSGKGSGNLFENLQEINKDLAQDKDTNPQRSPESSENVKPSDNTTPEVIELDDSLEEEHAVTEKDEKDEKEQLSEENTKDSSGLKDIVVPKISDQDMPEDEEMEESKNEDKSAASCEGSDQKLTDEHEQSNESNKQNCDNSNQVQSSDVDEMEVDSDDKETGQQNVQNEEESENKLLELGCEEKSEKDKKETNGTEDEEMKEEEDMEQDEEDKLLASDSESLEEKHECIKENSKDVTMDVEDGKSSDSRDSIPSSENLDSDSSKDKENEEEKPSVAELKLDSKENEKENVDKTDIKTESVQESVNKDEKDDKVQVPDIQDSNSNDASDRKRPADSDTCLQSTEPKRSRLDFVIGKLGSQIGIKPESLPLEEDTCVSDTEDSTRPDSEESSKSDDTSSSVSETEETEETEEEKSPRKKKKKKPIRLTRKELENIIKSKIMSYLKSERPRIIQELQTKVDELQEANEKWKQRAKDLEKQMLDLTVLQQKHEKRKAKTAALRQISTKTVAVQVDENKANLMSKLGQQQSTTPTKQVQKTPPKTAGSLSLPSTQLKSPVTQPNALTQQRTNTAPMLTAVPPKLTPMTITQVPSNSGGPKLNPSPQSTMPVTASSGSPVLQAPRTAFPSNQTVKSLLDTTRQAPNAAPKFVAQPPATNFIMVNTSQNLISSIANSAKTSLSKANSNVAQAIAVASSNQQIQGGVTGAVKVIDLTGEEENAAKKGLLPQNSPVLQTTTLRPPVYTQQIMRPVVSGQPSIGPNQVMRPVASGQQLGPNQGILLSTPAGTQIVRGAAPQAYQLVFNPTSPALRPGSVLTVVTAPNNVTAGIRSTTSYIPPSAPATSITTVPPQLKAGPVATTSVTSNAMQRPENTSTLAQSQVRPPPPLQSAPSTKYDESKKLVSDQSQHPAPLPHGPIYHVKHHEKPLPPQPTLKISRVSQGIVLSWNMTLNSGSSHADIKSYQLFAYQEGSAPPSTNLWKKVGDVKALPLPMACTLTQFQEGNHYHFAVRPVDVNDRVGPFSKPSSIHLTKKD